jgi:hypothetical protein
MEPVATGEPLFFVQRISHRIRLSLTKETVVGVATHCDTE